MSDFYIGWQNKAPAELARWLRRCVVVLLMGTCFLSGLMIARFQPFAEASFEFDQPREFIGIVLEQPFPRLLVERPLVGAGGRHPGYSQYWLTAPGKFGAQELVRGFDRQLVRLRGELIYRDDQVMVKLGPGTLERLPKEPPAHVLSEDLMQAGENLGKMQLVGEIVDGQCFLGIMKPGRGITHRSCAIRCLSGGVPPLLWARAANGEADYYLVVGADGQANNSELLPWVADRIVVDGEVHRYNGFKVIRTSSKSIRLAD